MHIHLLCGIPGSGKSSLARHIRGYIVSTDSIRKFLWNDEGVIKHDKLVFQLAEQITEYLLSNGEDVIIDATNLTKKARYRFITLAERHQARVILHWVQTDLGTALKRNANRERKVPVSVIFSLSRALQPPELAEGYHEIHYYNEDLVLRRSKR